MEPPKIDGLNIYCSPSKGGTFAGFHRHSSATKDSHFSLQWQSSKRPQASLVDEASIENKDEEQFVYKMNISLSDLCSYTGSKDLTLSFLHNHLGICMLSCLARARSWT